MDAKLQKTVRRIESSIPQRSDLDTAMRNQMNRIRIRTLSGRDVNGFPFLRKKDGSPSYLNRTGTLLRSLQADATQDDRGLTGRVSVTGRAREYAPFVNAKRKFIGASQNDRGSVISDMKQAIGERRSEQ